MGKRNKEHSFSVEMKSDHYVRKMSFFDEEDCHVFFEGFLGELENIEMVEGEMLEIEGRNGTLKLDITQHEMEKCLAGKKAREYGGEKQ